MKNYVVHLSLYFLFSISINQSNFCIVLYCIVILYLIFLMRTTIPIACEYTKTGFGFELEQVESEVEFVQSNKNWVFVQFRCDTEIERRGSVSEMWDFGCSILDGTSTALMHVYIYIRTHSFCSYFLFQFIVNYSSGS